MAHRQRLICKGADLPECGRGVRFAIAAAPGEEKGFAIRHLRHVHGFVMPDPHQTTAAKQGK